MENSQHSDISLMYGKDGANAFFTCTRLFGRKDTTGIFGLYYKKLLAELLDT